MLKPKHILRDFPRLSPLFVCQRWMPLHSHPYRCNQPAAIPIATHPTTIKRENLLHYALHGFYGLSSFLTESLVFSSTFALLFGQRVER